MSTSDESYQTFVDAELVEVPADGEASAFVIDDASKADWGLRKLAEVAQARARDRLFVEAERDRLARWLLTREQARERFESYLTSLLRAFYDQLQADGLVTEKRRTYQLPHGRLSLRRAEPKFVRDDDLLLSALEGRYTKITAEVDWQALKPQIAPVSDQPLAECVLTETGEVLPGLRLQSPPTEQFKASPALD